jgi:hypothetical protein
MTQIRQIIIYCDLCETIEPAVLCLTVDFDGDQMVVDLCARHGAAVQAKVAAEMAPTLSGAGAAAVLRAGTSNPCPVLGPCPVLMSGDAPA